MAWGNLLNALSSSARSRETRETSRLYDRVAALYEASPYPSANIREFVADLVLEACQRADIVPIDPLTNALGLVADELLSEDHLLWGFPERPDFAALGVDESVSLRKYLVRKERFLLDHTRQMEIWREKIIRILEAIIGYLPSTLFKDAWGDPDPDDGTSISTALVDLLDDPATVLERVLITFYDDNVIQADLFLSLRERFDRRACLASGIDWDARHTTKRPIILPSMHAERQPSRLATLYTQGTPWEAFFLTPLPFSIPFPARFEHTHIVGGSGHGKTQLLQLGILRDLLASAADGRSVVVLDSQGDLIHTLSHLDLLAPGHPSGLSDRLMLIDPTDVEFPVALNMFDFKHEELGGLPLLEQERILNGTVELYEYFFGALLGAELTAKQGVVFKYLARLLLEIPDATIHTFRQLMENGEPFRRYMARLPPTARAFFEERFFDRSFSETKKQVLTRLWGVLSNTTFDRMFSHPRSKVDMFAALQDGRIVLVNTAKELLKDEGASILGRFFIALIAQAALRRAALPAHERTPSFVYIDEAADYFDERIGHLLNQARKYKVGMVLAHQNLDQLSPALRASVLTSTSTKYAGGLSAKDASALAGEMRCDPQFLHAQRKHRNTTSFACYVRNYTPHALSVSVPLGLLENHPAMSEAQFSRLLSVNRARYTSPLAEVNKYLIDSSSMEPAPKVHAAATTIRPTKPGSILPTHSAASSEPIKAEPAPAPQPNAPAQHMMPTPLHKPGRGGKQHQYLQHLIKAAAEQHGWRATIEEPILNGSGKVDVSLSREGKRIACEVSVTTESDDELQNVEKCLAAQYDQVLLVSANERHLASLRTFVTRHLDEQSVGRVFFLSPEEALSHIEVIEAPAAPTETVVRGYKVRVNRLATSPEDASARRRVVAEVIAKSLREK